MKYQELNLQELQETYGGANPSSTRISAESNTSSLLTLNYHWSQGDKSYQWNLQAGKDIQANVYVLNNRID